MNSYEGENSTVKSSIETLSLKKDERLDSVINKLKNKIDIMRHGDSSEDEGGNKVVDSECKVKPTSRGQQVNADDKRSYLMWENKDNVCWLDASMSLLVHNRTLLRTIDQSRSTQIANIIKDYFKAIEVLNNYSSLKQIDERLNEAKDLLEGVQKSSLQYLQPILKYKDGEPDSAFCSLFNLIASDKSAKNIFDVEFTWVRNCKKCNVHCVKKYKKTIITLSKAKEFQPDTPISNCLCPVCKEPDQHMMLHYRSLPQCLLFHFENGAGKGDLQAMAFQVNDRKYQLTGVVVLEKGKESPVNHFVTWIRNPLTDMWLECNDLGPDVLSFNVVPPIIELEDVYIIMYEAMDDIGTIVNLSRDECETAEEARNGNVSIPLVDLSDESEGDEMKGEEPTVPRINYCEPKKEVTCNERIINVCLPETIDLGNISSKRNSHKLLSNNHTAQKDNTTCMQNSSSHKSQTSQTCNEKLSDVGITEAVVLGNSCKDSFVSEDNLPNNVKKIKLDSEVTGVQPFKLKRKEATQLDKVSKKEEGLIFELGKSKQDISQEKAINSSVHNLTVKKMKTVRKSRKIQQPCKIIEVLSKRPTNAPTVDSITELQLALINESYSEDVSISESLSHQERNVCEYSKEAKRTPDKVQSLFPKSEKIIQIKTCEDPIQPFEKNELKEVSTTRTSPGSLMEKSVFTEKLKKFEVSKMQKTTEVPKALVRKSSTKAVFFEQKSHLPENGTNQVVTSDLKSKHQPIAVKSEMVKNVFKNVTNGKTLKQEMKDDTMKESINSSSKQHHYSNDYESCKMELEENSPKKLPLESGENTKEIFEDKKILSTLPTLSFVAKKAVKKYKRKQQPHSATEVLNKMPASAPVIKNLISSITGMQETQSNGNSLKDACPLQSLTGQKKHIQVKIPKSPSKAPDKVKSPTRDEAMKKYGTAAVVCSNISCENLVRIEHNSIGDSVSASSLSTKPKSEEITAQSEKVKTNKATQGGNLSIQDKVWEEAEKERSYLENKSMHSTLNTLSVVKKQHEKKHWKIQQSIKTAEVLSEMSEDCPAKNSTSSIFGTQPQQITETYLRDACTLESSTNQKMQNNSNQTILHSKIADSVKFQSTNNGGKIHVKTHIRTEATYRNISRDSSKIMTDQNCVEETINNYMFPNNVTETPPQSKENITIQLEKVKLSKQDEIDRLDQEECKKEADCFESKVIHSSLYTLSVAKKESEKIHQPFKTTEVVSEMPKDCPSKGNPIALIFRTESHQNNGTCLKDAGSLELPSDQKKNLLKISKKTRPYSKIPDEVKCNFSKNDEKINVKIAPITCEKIFIETDNSILAKTEQNCIEGTASNSVLPNNSKETNSGFEKEIAFLPEKIKSKKATQGVELSIQGEVGTSRLEKGKMEVDCFEDKMMHSSLNTLSVSKKQPEKKSWKIQEPYRTTEVLSEMPKDCPSEGNPITVMFGTQSHQSKATCLKDAGSLESSSDQKKNLLKNSKKTRTRSKIPDEVKWDFSKNDLKTHVKTIANIEAITCEKIFIETDNSILAKTEQNCIEDTSSNSVLPNNSKEANPGRKLILKEVAVLPEKIKTKKATQGVELSIQSEVGTSRLEEGKKEVDYFEDKIMHSPLNTLSVPEKQPVKKPRKIQRPLRTTAVLSKMSEDCPEENSITPIFETQLQQNNGIYLKEQEEDKKETVLSESKRRHSSVRTLAVAEKLLENGSFQMQLRHKTIDISSQRPANSLTDTYPIVTILGPQLQQTNETSLKDSFPEKLPSDRKKNCKRNEHISKSPDELKSKTQKMDEIMHVKTYGKTEAICVNTSSDTEISKLINNNQNCIEGDLSIYVVPNDEPERETADKFKELKAKKPTELDKLSIHNEDVALGCGKETVSSLRKRVNSSVHTLNVAKKKSKKTQRTRKTVSSKKPANSIVKENLTLSMQLQHRNGTLKNVGISNLLNNQMKNSKKIRHHSNIPDKVKFRSSKNAEKIHIGTYEKPKQIEEAGPKESIEQSTRKWVKNVCVERLREFKGTKLQKRILIPEAIVQQSSTNGVFFEEKSHLPEKSGTNQVVIHDYKTDLSKCHSSSKTEVSQYALKNSTNDKTPKLVLEEGSLSELLPAYSESSNQRLCGNKCKCHKMSWEEDIPGVVGRFLSHIFASYPTNL